MSMPLIPNTFSTSYDPFADELDFANEQRLRVRQNKESKSAIKKFKSKLISCDEQCQLEDIQKQLTARGIPQKDLEHQKSTLINRLKLQHKGSQFELSLPLFPKRDYLENLTIHIKPHNIRWNIASTSTAESITEFLIAAMEWIPVYDQIAEQLKIEVKQEELACQIAFDLIKRVVDEKMEGKGYKYQLFQVYKSSKADLIIYFSDACSITFEIALLKDFLDPVTLLIDSLPPYSGR